MAIVKVFTVRMRGAGSFTCRRCQRLLTLPEGGWLQLWDLGWTNVCTDVAELATVHRCGQEHYWVCSVCDAEQVPWQLSKSFNPRFTRRAASPPYECDTCGGELVQKTREIPQGEVTVDA